LVFVFSFLIIIFYYWLNAVDQPDFLLVFERTTNILYQSYRIVLGEVDGRDVALTVK